MVLHSYYLLLQEIEANRRFLLMVYQQNPKLLERADARIKQLFEVQNLMAPLDRGDAKEKPRLLSDVESACRVTPVGAEPPEVSKGEP